MIKKKKKKDTVNLYEIKIIFDWLNSKKEKVYAKKTSERLEVEKMQEENDQQ